MRCGIALEILCNFPGSIDVRLGIKHSANATDIIGQMRTFLCLLICTIACWAQRPEDQVLAVYSQMEKALQSGDADT